MKAISLSLKILLSYFQYIYNCVCPFTLTNISLSALLSIGVNKTCLDDTDRLSELVCKKKHNLFIILDKYEQ